MDPFDKNAIRTKIENGENFSISFKSTGYDLIMRINGIFAKLLAVTDQLYLLNSVISIIREVIANAEKANAKRLYFLASGLDINDNDAYGRGMNKFKSEVMHKPDFMHDLLSRSDYTIEVAFAIDADNLDIVVVNNAPLLPHELERIRFRLKESRKYNSLMDAFEDLGDETEGAGLGIALVVVTLKNIGIEPGMFRIDSVKNATRVGLMIPKKLKPQEIVTEIKRRMGEEIRELPPFPESAARIMQMCDDPDVSMDFISEGILSDPALASSVLKLSNSAAFITGKRIGNVSEAVKILGLQNIRSMVMVSGTHKVMSEKYSQYEEIWEHSNRVACYARHIGQKFHNAAVADKASTAGLLHDLGKIILLAADKEMARKIAEQVKVRMLITETFMEEISIGISHATLGGHIVSLWNFPDYLVESIQKHHSPMSASGEHEPVVHSVYLANMLCGIESHKYDYYYCYEAILEKYRLADPDEFEAFHESLKKLFER